MTTFKLFGAALIVSTSFATPAFAQVPEPGDYAYSQEPGLAAVYRPTTGAVTVQPGRVDVGGLRPTTRPRRPRYISSTRAQ
jgi:hypothetical protein